MGPWTGQTAAQREAERDKWLQAAKASHPGWDIHPLLSGWLAVPVGTPVVQAVDLDGIVEKLRQHEAASRH